MYLYATSACAQLSSSQQEQIERQLAAHDVSAPYDVPVRMHGGNVSVRVQPHVLRPMSSARLAEFLAEEPSLRDASVLDVGTGCGVQAIAVSRAGASRVVAADISEHAVANAGENFATHNIAAQLHHGDLFAPIPGLVVDTIIFAHPYFGAPPLPEYPVTRGMLDDGTLLQRFLREAHLHVRRSIFMPFLSLAGDTNDPALHAPRWSYEVRMRHAETLTDGLQQGEFFIYELVPRG